MAILIKYNIVLLITIYSFSCIAQVNVDVGDNKSKLLSYSNIGKIQSISVDDDSCTYLYTQLSHQTNEDGTPIIVDDRVYTPKKSKRAIWVAKINYLGDTLFTKILYNIPEFWSIRSVLEKKGVVYFLVSNTYNSKNKTRNGCILISYDHKIDKITSQQIFEDPFDLNSFFIKDNYSFYLIVNDLPHLCLPPEYQIYLLQLNNNGKVIKKTLLDKTICMRGEYSPSLVHINKNTKQYYLTTADFFKNTSSLGNSCDLDLYDKYGETSIPYKAYSRYISLFDRSGIKLKRIPIPCHRKIIGFFNEMDYVSINTDDIVVNKKVNFIFEDIKRKYREYLEVEIFNSHTIKMLDQDLFVFNFSSDTVNIKRIRGRKLVSNKTYVQVNYNDQYGNEITPVILKDKIRYYYIKKTSDSSQEISYFDESI